MEAGPSRPASCAGLKQGIGPGFRQSRFLEGDAEPAGIQHRHQSSSGMDAHFTGAQAAGGHQSPRCPAADATRGSTLKLGQEDHSHRDEIAPALWRAHGGRSSRLLENDQVHWLPCRPRLASWGPCVADGRLPSGGLGKPLAQTHCPRRSADGGVVALAEAPVLARPGPAGSELRVAEPPQSSDGSALGSRRRLRASGTGARKMVSAPVAAEAGAAAVQRSTRAIAFHLKLRWRGGVGDAPPGDRSSSTSTSKRRCRRVAMQRLAPSSTGGISNFGEIAAESCTGGCAGRLVIGAAIGRKRSRAAHGEACTPARRQCRSA